MFLCKVLPQAWILQNSILDEFNSMLYDDRLDIPYACHSSDLVAPILERLVTRVPEGIFYNYPYMLNTQGNVVNN